MALQQVDRFEWERIVRRCILPGPTKLVGFTMAQYGDARGNSIRPGLPRLAAVCGIGESTVRRHIERLRELDLIERLSNGGGPRRLAARYRLTIPEDLLDRVKLLDPDEITPSTWESGVQSADKEQDFASPLTQESGDSESSTPVDNFATPLTMVSGVASTHQAPHGGNSAHLGGQLRSLEGVTPLTAASTYQGPTKHQPKPDLPASSHQDARCLRGENPGFLDARRLNPACRDCRNAQTEQRSVEAS